MNKYIIKEQKNNRIIVKTENEDLQSYLRTLFIDVYRIIYQYWINEYNIHFEITSCIGYSGIRTSTKCYCEELKINYVIEGHDYIILKQHQKINNQIYETQQLFTNNVEFPKTNVLLFLNQIIKHKYDNILFNPWVYNNKCTYNSKFDKYKLFFDYPTRIFNVKLLNGKLEVMFEFIEILRAVLKK